MKNSAPPAPPLYGAFLSVRGRAVLIVGGGAVAARKAATLLNCGARVTVVAPQFDATLLGLKCLALKLVRRRYRSSDLKAQCLVFAATNDEALNARICSDAAERGMWSNSASPPEAGDFFVPATVQRGGFAIAVSTGGASAALAAHWRKRLEKLCGAEWGELAALQTRMRSLAKAQIGDPILRRKILLKLGAPTWAAKIRKLGTPAVLAAMEALIAKHSPRPENRRR